MSGKQVIGAISDENARQNSKKENLTSTVSGVIIQFIEEYPDSVIGPATEGFGEEKMWPPARSSSCYFTHKKWKVDQSEYSHRLLNVFASQIL